MAKKTLPLKKMMDNMLYLCFETLTVMIIISGGVGVSPASASPSSGVLKTTRREVERMSSPERDRFTIGTSDPTLKRVSATSLTFKGRFLLKMALTDLE